MFERLTCRGLIAETQMEDPPMVRQTQKNSPRASRVASGVRVLWLAVCFMAIVTPRLAAEITLVSRLSDARAEARNKGASDDPPPQMQTDFLPANLGNSAMVNGESGVANANCTSNSSILADDSMETLRVSGDGTAAINAFLSDAYASATAKLLVITFTLTDGSYSYSLTGQLSADHGSLGFSDSAATAKLTANDATVFEVVANGLPPVTLSESGILQPGNYTLAVDVSASAAGGDFDPSSSNSSANFSFALEQAATSTPTPTPTAAASPTPFEGGTIFWESFDTVVPPTLPSGWNTSFTSGPADCTLGGTCTLGTNWVTTTSNPYSGPICVFHDAPGCVTDSVLDTRPFSVPNVPYDIGVSFRHRFDLESGRDGGVLEISINGGRFTDIVTAGGGAGGYNGTISMDFLSPIAGRRAWT